MSFRMLAALLAAVALVACGPKPRPIPDSGDEDAGEDAGIDAGRVRGEDPPTGWSQVAFVAADAGQSSSLGFSVASAPDQFGQPLVASVYVDPNGDGNEQDNRLTFTRWNGTLDGGAGFEPLKTIEVVGELDSAFVSRQVSIVREPTTGRIAIAYVKNKNTLRYAWSDDEGANFSLKTIATQSAASVANPVVVNTSQGLLVVSANANTTGGVNIEGVLNSSASFSVTGALGAPFAVATDDSGAPGLAFFQYTNGTAGELQLKFKRPWATAGAEGTIANSAGFDALQDQSSLPSVSLTFEGSKPRVAYHLRSGAPVSPDDASTELWFAAASDATGASWATPVAISRNGDGTRFNSTRSNQAITVTPSGAVSIAARFAAVGTVGSLCRGPKFATSTNGTTFNNCGVPNTPFDFAGEWLSMWLYTGTKNSLIFRYSSSSHPTFKAGIVMWRQP